MDVLVAIGFIAGLVAAPVMVGVGLIEGRPVPESFGIGLATFAGSVGVAAWAGFVAHVADRYLL